MSPSRYSKSFSILSDNVSEFIEAVNKQKLSNLATGDWTVKDVLCHVAFWHQYYAKQYKDLAAGKQAFVFTSKGGSMRNHEGVNLLKNYSKTELFKLLNNSNKSLYL